MQNFTDAIYGLDLFYIYTDLIQRKRHENVCDEIEKTCCGQDVGAVIVTALF